jgi:type II secretory pathway component PulF
MSENLTRPATPSPSYLGLSAEDLITLNEQIAAMTRANLPLDQGLAALGREMGRGRLGRVTSEIADDLRAGKTLPEALQQQTGRLPAYYPALVAAGVRSGRVADVLSTLTLYARTMTDLRTNVLGSLLYPCLLFAAALGLIVLTLTSVVPKFDKIFSDFRMKLPRVTEIVITLSHVPWEYFVLPPLLLVALLFMARLVLLLSPAGRRLWARWVYAIPLVGTLLRSARLANFTELLAILVEHSVPLPEAFRLAGAAASDPLTAAASRLIEEDLRSGIPLVDSLRSRRALPEVISWLAGQGDRRGDLAQTLRRVSGIYRNQADLRSKMLRSILPSGAVVVVTVAVVGLALLALFAPLIALMEGLSGGGRRGGGGGGSPLAWLFGF